jgi:hypothetical protein
MEKPRMSWLIKTDKDKFEIWSDKEYLTMKSKCEYYGSTPSWVEVRQLESPSTTVHTLRRETVNEKELIPDIAFHNFS